MKELFDINGAKKFWRMAAAALAVFASLAFASCSDMISDGQSQSLIAPAQSASGGEAVITLSLSLENAASSDGGFEISKTVAPTSYDNTEVSTLSEIRFYAKLSSSAAALGTSDTLLASWENCSKMDSEPYSQSMAAGTYDFMLTANKCGALMSQTLSGKTLAAGTTTTLAFNSLAADASGAQVGVVEVDVGYSNAPEAFKKYVSTTEPRATLSMSLDSNLAASSALPTSWNAVSGKDESGNSYSIGRYSASFASVPISAGFHILTFTFKAADQSVFVYPVSVFIQTGCLSKATVYPFNRAQEVAQASGGQSRSVTYNSNTASAVTATQTFYSGSSIADAEALGFEAPAGKRFKCWTTNSDGTGTSYAAGGKPTLGGDITLYAQWGSFTKVTYFLNTSNGTDAYIQQYESGNSLTALEAAFPVYAASSYAEEYTFCGWDTSADGSGTRYAAGASPTFGEDAVLYAQWCGAKVGGSGTYKDYYKVSDAKQWNAVMGAPFANQTAGTIKVDVQLVYSIEKPDVSITKNKIFAGNIRGAYNYYRISQIGGTLFDQVAEGATVSWVTLTVGSVCNVNKGTIESVTVENTAFTGKSAITNENASTGVIKNCSVSDCAVTGNGTCAGAVCGVNNGTIEDCNVTSSKVDGKTNNVTYTGGICGWNKGKISASSSSSSRVDIELFGNDAADARYGYVIGKNDGTVSVNVTSAKSETTSKPEIEFSKETYYKLVLTRTSKVTVTVTDGMDWGKSDCAISKYTEWSQPDIAHVQGVDETSKTFSGGYLEKGTYYIILHENYVGKGHAAVSWTVE